MLSRKAAAERSDENAAEAAYDLLEHLDDRPALQLLLGVCINGWDHAVRRFADHLWQDRTQIARLLDCDCLPPIRNLRDERSDPHDGQQTVFTLAFQGGQTIGYKPRPAQIDQRWNDLLTWFEGAGAPWSLRQVRVAAGQDHGWFEWIPRSTSANSEERSTFFRNAGALACLLQMLQGTDFHLENVVATATAPVAVDLECLLHPWLTRERKRLDRATDAAVRALRGSVAGTGFLPTWTNGDDNQIALGGLSPPLVRKVRTEAEPASLSDLHEGNGPLVDFPIEQHSPLERGARFAAEDVAMVLYGYEEAYRFLADHASDLLEPDGALARFADVQTRVILRSTASYALMLQQLKRRAANREIDDFKTVAAALLRSTGEDMHPAILESEAAALARLDVPRFSATPSSRTLRLDGGAEIRAFFEQAPLTQARERLTALNPKRLARQLELLEVGLSGTITKDEVTKLGVRRGGLRKGPREGGPLPHAEWIGSSLHEACFGEGEDGRSWVVSEPVRDGSQPSLGVISDDLYSGLAGVAVFFAALARETAKEEHALAARACMSSARRRRVDRRQASLGAGTGVGGHLYSLTLIQEYAPYEQLLLDVEELLESLSPQLIREDRALDVLDGTAGLALGLLSVEERLGFDAGPLIEACGAHLVNRLEVARNDGFEAWVTINPAAPITGMAHGAAGISNALSRMYARTRDLSLLEAAQAGIAFEERCLDSSRGCWRSSGSAPPDAEPLCRWCHGAPGIGIARLAQGTGGRKAVDVALELTLERGFGAWDSLCCGNIGRLEAIQLLGDGDDERIDAQVRRLAEAVMRRAAKHGSHRWPGGGDGLNPGFFVGAAGVGYALLRLNAQPTSPLRAVSAWE